MFTGLVKDLGIIEGLGKRADTLQLHVRATLADVEIGDSIAVNGVCLTVTNIREGILSFDVSEETLKRSNLGQLSKGERVNLEPSLRLSDKLGGHLVTGHVDSIGKILNKTATGRAYTFEIGVTEQTMRYIVKKGSIALDGISLTVADLKRDSFTVVVIPHTYEVTNLRYKNIGDSVNIETDIIGKYVERFLNPVREEKLLSTLQKAGFL